MYFPFPGFIDTQIHTGFCAHVPLKRYLKSRIRDYTLPEISTGESLIYPKKPMFELAIDFSMSSPFLLLHTLVGGLSSQLYNHFASFFFEMNQPISQFS